MPRVYFQGRDGSWIRAVCLAESLPRPFRAGPMEEDDAWIRAVIVGKDRASLVEFVHDDRLYFSNFDKVVAGYRPVAGAGNRILRGQFFKGPAVVLRVLDRRKESRACRAEFFR